MPHLYTVTLVGVVGLSMTIIGYSEVATSSREGRIAYYVLRSLSFLFVIMATGAIMFLPLIALIRRRERSEAEARASSAPPTNATAISKASASASFATTDVDTEAVQLT